MRKPFRLGLAAAALWAWAGLAAAQPPVWTIHDKDSTIVLFGSVHVLPPGVAGAHAQAKLTSSVSPSNSAVSVAGPDARLMLPVAGRAVPASTSVPFP